MEIQKNTKHHKYTVGIDEDDVMIEIFLWLPVKSLTRFKRLSKRWHFLISHRDSYFRCDYLTNITTRGRKRIVGSYDHSPPIMAGFFFQVCCVGKSYDRVRFLPTSTEFVKAADKQKEGGEGGTIVDPFSSFLDYESLDRFLLFNCLQYDLAPDIEKIHILASSNGFLLCSLEKIYPINYCLVNPVTKEWIALPEPKIIEGYVEIGFVCKGNYPSLNSVEYTIVRATWSRRPFFSTTTLLLEIFSSGDDQWRQFNCSSDQPSRPFYLAYKHNPVIVNNSDQGGDGIVIYFLAMLKSAKHSIILVFDFKNKDDQKGRDLLQMIETPGQPEEKSGNNCDDHIAEFDGVLHCIRYKSSYSNTYIELWVLNRSTNSTGEWFLKHTVSLTKMMEGCPWIDVRWWKETFHIQGFHPMNPNLIFLTLDQKMVWCNFESGTLELVCDFRAQNLLQRYFHYAYQWPCWPPLL